MRCSDSPRSTICAGCAVADLGHALLDLMGGGQVGEADYYDPPGAVDVLVDYYGSLSAAARELGIPRRTMRGWAEGRTPRGGGGWLSELAAQLERDMYGAPDIDDGDVEISGTFRYAGGGSMKGAEDRTVNIGDYLSPGTMANVRAAYLAGADGPQLAEIFHAGINDNGFYADTFDPANPSGGWDIDIIGGR